MNKFAKYVPEEDKKKQREHIGAMGMADMPFGEVKGENIIQRIVDPDKQGTYGGVKIIISEFNRNEKYTVEIRGDVYENVTQYDWDDYYDYRILGYFNPDDWNDYSNGPYPFTLMVGMALYDMDRFWAADGSYIYTDESGGIWAELRVDTSNYPDLDIENEVKIYRTEIKTIDPKFLPNGGATCVIVTISDGGDGNLVADKTATEIENLFNEGFIPYARLDSAPTFLYTYVGLSESSSGNKSAMFGIYDATYPEVFMVEDDYTVSMPVPGAYPNIRMMSPDGTIYMITVTNDGKLEAHS